MVDCPICGIPFEPGKLELIGTFQRYLVLVFLISCAVRFRTYRQSLTFFVRLPREWPKLFELVRQHKAVFLTWLTVLPVGITLLMLALHSVCLWVIWNEAAISSAQIADSWPVAALVLVAGMAMLVLDGSTLFGAGAIDFDGIEHDLNRGERVLSPRASLTIRAVTLGLVNPHKVVGDRVKSALATVNFALVRQMRWWTLQTAVRILFGFLLWLSWGLRIGALSPVHFWLVSLSLLAMVGLTVRWMVRSSDDELTQDDV